MLCTVALITYKIEQAFLYKCATSRLTNKMKESDIHHPKKCAKKKELQMRLTFFFHVPFVCLGNNFLFLKEVLKAA